MCLEASPLCLDDIHVYFKVFLVALIIPDIKNGKLYVYLDKINFINASKKLKYDLKNNVFKIRLYAEILGYN